MAYKPWALLTMAVVPAIAFPLWSRVVRRPVAALLTLATALVGLGVPSTEPYAWVPAALLPPVAVIALRAFGSGLGPGEGRPARGNTTALAGVGLFLGMAGAVYTLLFVFSCLLLAALALPAVLSARRGVGLRPALRSVSLRLAVIGVAALPLILPVWTPYAAQAIARGWPGVGAAGRYLPDASAFFPFPMLESSLLGILSLAGAAWLVLRFQRRAAARALGVLALTCYGWFALSTLALAAGTTLLAFRVLVPLTVALACAGVLGALDAAQAVRRGLRSEHRRAAVTAAALLGMAGAVSIAQAVPVMHREDLRLAYNDYYPTGSTALGERDRGKPGAWYPDLQRTIAAETGKQPADLVLLSNDYGLLALHPYWGFQQVTVHYANPLADYDGRLAEVRRWAQAADAQDFIGRLNASPYRPPDVFVLEERPDGYHATLTRDAFPRQPNVERSDVVFDKALFPSNLFSKAPVGPFTVLVRR
jgi:galactan 5-O-arabinofuranosyltransferase